MVRKATIERRYLDKCIRHSYKKRDALTYNILWIDVGGRYPKQGQIRKKKADRCLIYIYEYEYRKKRQIGNRQIESKSTPNCSTEQYDVSAIVSAFFFT